MNATLTSLCFILSRLSAFILAAILMLELVKIAFRGLFDTSPTWSYDLSVYGFCLSTLLALPQIIISQDLIRVDIFYNRLALRNKSMINGLACLVLLFPPLAWSAWKSVPWTLNSWMVLEKSANFGGLPGLFLLKTALSLTLAFCALTALFSGVHALGLRNQRP